MLYRIKWFIVQKLIERRVLAVVPVRAQQNRARRNFRR